MVLCLWISCIFKTLCTSIWNVSESWYRMGLFVVTIFRSKSWSHLVIDFGEEVTRRKLRWHAYHMPSRDYLYSAPKIIPRLLMQHESCITISYLLSRSEMSHSHLNLKNLIKMWTPSLLFFVTVLISQFKILYTSSHWPKLRQNSHFWKLIMRGKI